MHKPPSYANRFVSDFCIAVALLLISTTAFGQRGISLNTPESFDGYTLCTASQAGTTYLINNCGEIVNEWESTFPDNYCRLTKEGHLIFIQNNTIIEKSWDDNILNTIQPASEGLLITYEVMKLDNGNFLAAARRFVSHSVFEDLGWDPDRPIPARFDGVVELSPTGQVVWEWNIMNHTIQNRDPNASNFGISSNHPELVDINQIESYDWQYAESFMINGIDYNPDLDQILISVRKINEVMIIDHSTTTEEAKGGTGGNSGKGGRILYRWGNPKNYGQGNESDRILYFQHNPNWIQYGEHKDKIIMFNNGLSRNVPGFPSYSSVHIIDPPINENGTYDLSNNQPYAPDEADVTIDLATTGTDFYSGYTSGAQVLPNGNIYITVGGPSQFLEVDTEGDLVWDYSLAFSSYIFRSERYAPDFPGFADKNLIPKETIEFPSSPYDCELYMSTSTDESTLKQNSNIYFDQASQVLTVTNSSSGERLLQIHNIQGHTIASLEAKEVQVEFDMMNLSSGVYVVSIYDKNSGTITSKKFVKI